MVSTYFYPYRGGAEVQAERLATWLVQHGVPVMVITRQVQGAPRRENLNGIEIYRVPRLPTPILRGAAFVGLGLWWMFKHRKKFDVIHTHDPSLPSTLSYVFTRFFSRPLVINLHRGGTLGDLQRLLDRGWYGQLHINAYRRSDNVHFVVISEDIREEMRREKVRDDHVHFLVNGVDAETFAPVSQAEKLKLRQQLGLPTDKPVVAVVCRHVDTKGLDVLLDAWKQVPDAHLVIVGSGPLTESLKAKADAELPGRVSFPGKVESVLPYLQMADAWTLPSLTEALPVSMLEAMACELPVVVTEVGGIPEVIESGVNGLIVPPGNAGALAQALTKIVSGSPEVKQFGQKARQTILDRYSLSEVARTYYDLYTRLIAKK
jgi:glycosyltransferase involved in cell wall biosynthesis